MTSLIEQFKELAFATKEAFAETSFEEKQALQQDVLGRKGKLAGLFSQLQNLPLDERKDAGRVANETKHELEELFKSIDQERASLSEDQLKEARTWTKRDETKIGFEHPISNFLLKARTVFVALGFEVIDSPELENEEYNFDLLNIPEDHPARDEWDTFFVRKPKSCMDAILRTHTSPMQIRSMKKRKPPVRIIVPGRVFRHEATDASHGSVFYQCEGFVIDKHITLTDLMGTLDTFIKELFGKDVETRFRPHYYPFVEPGMDVDMKFKKPGDQEASWLEVLGSGMIHPDVLKNMGVDPDTYSGFAFGLGIDRLAMLYWGIEDIRHFYSGNLSFLRSFS